MKSLLTQLNVKRVNLQKKAPDNCLPSIVVYTRLSCERIRKQVTQTHSRKLGNLSEEQSKPLFTVKNTVRLCNIDKVPPKYVLETLSLGPKNPVSNKFEQKDILTELDCFLEYCKDNDIQEDAITDINIKTLNYIKKCKKLKESRNVVMTQKYLKSHELLAVPFDKGVGICLMKVKDYRQKMDSIINLPQFKRYKDDRSNARHPLLKEEERIQKILFDLKKEGSISEDMYWKLRPSGSQHPRLYGLAKVHKKDIPVRPVLSMPGSAYHKIAKQVAEWLSHVPECNINCSTKSISDLLRNTQLDKDHELVSFDVVSLYTNVPVKEAIDVCADLLFKRISLPIDKKTFIILAEIASCNVIMSTHDGLYQQIDGLAMGSPPAPHLANGWMSQFDPVIKESSSIYDRYMDDIIQDLHKNKYEGKLEEINNLHPSLTFTGERQDAENHSLTFLDMRAHNSEGKISTTWYTKPTDTGLIMNFHALAPNKYKRSVVSGFVHRIYRACSDWTLFHQSLDKAKTILQENQYPECFYEPIINDTLTKIIKQNSESSNRDENDTSVTSQTFSESQDDDPNRCVHNIENKDKFLFFVQYRGKCTEEFARALHKLNAPCRIVMTLRKVKTVLPSLKPSVERIMRSNVVYKITCPRCQSCYVGQTKRKLQRRFTEHLKKAQ